MLVPPNEAAQFLRLYQSLLGFAAGRLGGVGGVSDLISFKAASLKAKASVRDALYDRPELIDQYVDENTEGRPPEELALIHTWHLFVRGKFFVVADLKRHTVFLSEREPPRAYGVLGLTTEIADMLPGPLPVMLEAVLLPWKGHVVCDGLVSAYSVGFGSNIRRSIMESYREAKTREGIMTSLDRPAVRGARRQNRPGRRHSAIQRILHECPQTVEAFVQRHGEPSSVLTGEAAQERGLWGVDGRPALKIDLLMVYSSILRKRVLYVYASRGRVTHLGVIDPADW